MSDNQERFLASFFDDKLDYAEVKVHDFWLVRQIHGVTGKPVYAVYPEESFKRYRNQSQRFMI